MITISWHLILYIVFAVYCLYKAANDSSRGIGAGFPFALWIILLIVVTAIYGGIFWW